jgi:hydroxymethylpyrimidine pyrophosphatase-like HAD family hydrolase
MKKAIYIDLDGTLLDNSYKISKKDKNFLFSIKEN